MGELILKEKLENPMTMEEKLREELRESEKLREELRESEKKLREELREKQEEIDKLKNQKEEKNSLDEIVKEGGETYITKRILDVRCQQKTLGAACQSGKTQQMIDGCLQASKDNVFNIVQGLNSQDLKNQTLQRFENSGLSFLELSSQTSKSPNHCQNINQVKKKLQESVYHGIIMCGNKAQRNNAQTLLEFFKIHYPFVDYNIPYSLSSIWIDEGHAVPENAHEHWKMCTDMGNVKTFITLTATMHKENGDLTIPKVVPIQDMKVTSFPCSPEYVGLEELNHHWLDPKVGDISKILNTMPKILPGQMAYIVVMRNNSKQLQIVEELLSHKQNGFDSVILTNQTGIIQYTKGSSKGVSLNKGTLGVLAKILSKARRKDPTGKIAFIGGWQKMGVGVTIHNAAIGPDCNIVDHFIYPPQHLPRVKNKQMNVDKVHVLERGCGNIRSVMKEVPTIYCTKKDYLQVLEYNKRENASRPEPDEGTITMRESTRRFETVHREQTVSSVPSSNGDDEVRFKKWMKPENNTKIAKFMKRLVKHWKRTNQDYLTTKRLERYMTEEGLTHTTKYHLTTKYVSGPGNAYGDIFQEVNGRYEITPTWRKYMDNWAGNK